MFEFGLRKDFCNTVVLFVPKTLKTARPDHHLPPIELKTFNDIELCEEVRAQ